MISALVLRKLAGPAILAIIVGGGFLFLKAKYEDYKTLQLNEIVLKGAIERQKAVIIKKTEEHGLIIVARDELLVSNQKLRDEKDALHRAFNKKKPDGTERDLGVLAKKKSVLVRGVINKGTKRAFGCLEDITNEKATTTDCGIPGS